MNAPSLSALRLSEKKSYSSTWAKAKFDYQIIAIEQSIDSVDYKKIRTAEKVAFIVGNEVTGVSPSVLKLCDAVAEIPMKGEKESLNVSVALGVALFRMLNI